MVYHFWQSIDAILEDVSVTEELFNAELLIWGLPYFSVHKNYLSPTRVTRLNVAPNMADPIGLKENRPLP